MLVDTAKVLSKVVVASMVHFYLIISDNLKSVHKPITSEESNWKSVRA